MLEQIGEPTRDLLGEALRICHLYANAPAGDVFKPLPGVSVCVQKRFAVAKTFSIRRTSTAADARRTAPEPGMKALCQ